MGLELKVEALRARGMLTREERDHLLQALGNAPVPTPARRPGLLTPLRIFLIGMVAGVSVAYLTWWILL